VNLFEELTALVGALEADHVDYALAGALALAVWGVPRATQDIDLLVPQAAVAAAVAVARRRGFTVEALPIRFTDGMAMRRLSKIEGEAVLVLDLLVVDAGLDPVWRDRRRLATDRGPIWVVSREGLVRMKTAAGRPQDLVDVQRLEELDR
jgi:hypothetical protein